MAFLSEHSCFRNPFSRRPVAALNVLQGLSLEMCRGGDPKGTARHSSAPCSSSIRICQVSELQYFTLSHIVILSLYKSPID